MADQIKGPKKSTLVKDSSVPLMHRDPSDLRLIRLTEETQNRFLAGAHHLVMGSWFLDFRIQSSILIRKTPLAK